MRTIGFARSAYSKGLSGGLQRVAGGEWNICSLRPTSRRPALDCSTVSAHGLCGSPT